MLGLLIVLFFISPIIAIIAIIFAIRNSRKSIMYSEEIDNLKFKLDLYKEKYGVISDEIIEERKKEITEKNNLSNVENIEVREVESIDRDNIIESKSNEEEIYSTPLNTLIKEYINKNNISQGNLLFALGVIFISIAGIVFATTTWNIIPNIYKILIILVVALLFRFLSNFSKNKFKLVKASITFYMLFCILISLIILSMGYFNMLGSYLTIGGNGQFLLYAISLLIFIILFAIFTLEYNFYNIASKLLYAVNIEVLLIVLNFTKRFDLLMFILSIYNLILMVLSNKIKNNKFIFTTKMSEVSNNTLLLISLLSIINVNYGILMSIISVCFAILFLNDYIVFENKKYNSINYKFIIVPIFLIFSCIRFNAEFNFIWTSEYLMFLIIILSCIFIGFDKYKKDNFLYMIYLLIVAFCISLYKDFFQFDITIKYLITLFINLIQIIILLIKSKNKIFKYIKTFLYIIFALSLSRYLFVNANCTPYIAISIMSLLLFFGYTVSVIIDRKLFKNKFVDIFVGLFYEFIILINLLGTTFSIDKNYVIFDKMIIYSILLIISISINYINQILYSDNEKIKDLSFIHNLFLFPISCFVIKINPIAPLIVLISIIYDFIKNKNKFYEYILLFSYLIYINLLSYFVFVDYRIFLILALIVLIILISNFVDYKKIRNLDLKTIDTSIMLNLMLISFIEFVLYSNFNVLIISIFFNIWVFYLYFKRKNNYVFSILFLIYNNFLAYCVVEEYRIFIILISICLFFISNEISKYNKNIIKNNRLLDGLSILNLSLVSFLEINYYGNLKYNIAVLLLFNICLIYLYFNRNEKYKNIIEVVIQFSMFILLGYTYSFFENSSYFLLFDYEFYILYYILFMIISIVSIFIENISGLTKYCTVVALFICGFRIILNIFLYQIFNNDLYILNLFLLIYLISVLIRLKSKNINYNSKYIVPLVFGQIAVLELTFLHIIREKLLLFYDKINFKSILHLGINVNCLFYLVIINFLIFAVFKKIFKGFDYKKNINKSLLTYEVVMGFVKWNYLLIAKIIVVSGTVFLYFLMFVENPYINFYGGKVFMFIRYIIITSLINITLFKTKLEKYSRIFVFLIPFVFIECFIHNINIKYFSLLVYFIAYYILSFVIKNKKTKINFEDIEISYFAASNFVIIPYFNSMIRALNAFLLNKLLLKSLSISVLDLMFAGIFVLQFRTKNRFIDKCINSFSIFLITLALLLQNLIIINNFEIEYYLLIITISIYILDKFIWKFENLLSSYIWIFFHILAFTIMFCKNIASSLIINTVVFGVVMFLLLLISFVIKKYYHFLISFIFMILTSFYITRNFWLSVEWWAYLLIVGILLIIFATKNEQLKNENKNFIIAIKEFNKKIKSKF